MILTTLYAQYAWLYTVLLDVHMCASTLAQMCQVGVGLGASGSSHGLYNSAGTYRETLRQLTKSRYDSVFQD